MNYLTTAGEAVEVWQTEPHKQIKVFSKHATAFENRKEAQAFLKKLNAGEIQLQETPPPAAVPAKVAAKKQRLKKVSKKVAAQKLGSSKKSK